MMFKFLYSLAVDSYFFLIRIVSLYNKKAKLFISGRKDSKESLSLINDKRTERMWFHCASLGEFEQIKPIVTQLKSKNENLFIAITFFSPSGFESSKNYKDADWIGYIPKDTKSEAKFFLDKLKPTKAIFVKYDLWYCILNEVFARNIPVYMVSARFRKSGVLNPVLRKKYSSLLVRFKKIFTQDENSFGVLNDEGLSNAVLSGDTRIDRVREISKMEFNNESIDDFVKDSFTLIIGSSWQSEEQIMLEVLEKSQKKIKLIIAPHEINRSEEIKERFSKFGVLLLSEYSQNSEADVLIIDKIGILSKAYRKADLALVGGGFKNALHNIFEPAIYGIPVLYGNNTEKFNESEVFKKNGFGFSIENSEQVIEFINKPKSFFEEVKNNSEKFFESNNSISSNIVSELIA